MPCNCFGKKDKSAAAAAEKYSCPGEQESIPPPASAPAPVQAPAPTQTEAAPATPPTPVTPTSGDPRLRPEDDPDKASRRRDVVASFYSDQCELIGFKATGSRPPSAVVGGGTGENPAATSSPLGSPPFSSRASALSRADLALKRREFFKDLAVNDMSSSRYGASQPSWRMVDAGSLTTPRRSHQYDGSRTLPAQVRYGGLVLRPISGPAKATSGPDLHIINGEAGNSHDHQTYDAKTPEEEPLLGAGAPQEYVTQHQEADAVESLLARQQSEGDQPILAPPVTPPVTPATPPPTPPAKAEPSSPEIPSLDQPLGSETLIELAATHLEDSLIPPQREESQLVVQQQQYVQQVSVPSDDERLAEGSCILIKEAFPEEPHPHLEMPSQDDPDTTNASGTTLQPSVTHEAFPDVSQHSSAQPSTPPPTDIPSQRRSSLPEKEEGRGAELLRHADQAMLDTDRDLNGPTSSPETFVPDFPVGESVSTAPPEQQSDPSHPQQESTADSQEARLSPTIVGCIPKTGPTQEAEPRPPSPPHTPPTTNPSSPLAPEETHPPTPSTQPTIKDQAPPTPPTPPSLSGPRMTCGMDASSSPLEDDGLGSDIDEALGSLECLTEEGNNEKRATAST